MEHILKIETDRTSFIEWFNKQIDSLLELEFPTSDQHYSSYFVALGPCNYLRYDAAGRLFPKDPRWNPLKLTLLGFYKPKAVQQTPLERTDPNNGEPLPPEYQDRPGLILHKRGRVLDVTIGKIKASRTRLRFSLNAADMDHVSILLRSIATEYEHTREQFDSKLLKTLQTAVSPAEWAHWEKLDWVKVLTAPPPVAAVKKKPSSRPYHWFPKTEEGKEKWQEAWAYIVVTREQYTQEYDEGESENPNPSIADLQDMLLEKEIWTRKPSVSTVGRITRAGDEGWLD